MSGVAEKRKIQLLSITLVVSAVVMLVKFVTWYFTKSNAILSDAAESLVNIIAGAFALYSVKLASKPRDMEHPYGHGKVEYLAAGLEGFLILAAGITIIGKSVYNIFIPTEVTMLDLGVGLTLFTGLVNFFMGWMLQSRGKKMNSLTMISDGKHLTSDAWTSAGLVIGLLVIHFTQILWLDSVIAILFGFILLWFGFQLFRKSISGVMDEADKELLEQLIGILEKNRRPQWIDIHNLRIIKYGAALHIDCHVTFPWYWNLQRVHQDVEDIESLIRQEIGTSVELFVHSDPCLPASCHLCSKFDCEVRQHPFQKKLSWTLKNVLKNRQHQMEEE